MHYEKSADLQEQFNLVRMQYEALSNVGIPVSNDCYWSLVINFVLPELSSFLVTDLALDAVLLMQVAVEEWDRCEAELKSVSKGTEEDTDITLVMVPDEEAKARLGGSRSQKRGKPGICWNCGGRGHRCDACPNPNMAVADEERSEGMCQSDSDESEWNTPGGSCSGSSSKRLRSRSRDPDMSAAPLEEDSNNAGGISASAVGELDTYEAIDEVDEPESMEILTECNRDKAFNVKDVLDVAAVVNWTSNSSLPPCIRLEMPKLHEEQPNWEMVVIPVELKTEEVDVPEESGFLDDSSVSHHVLTCCEETVSNIIEELLKPSKVIDALEGWVNLDAGHWDSPNSSWADELEAGGVRVQARMLDSGGALSAVYVLMVVAVVLGMKKELNDEKNDMGQHTLKDFTTNTQAIMEGTWSIVFNAGTNENFMFDGERDLPVMDLIVDESRGSNGLEGLENIERGGGCH